MKTSYQELWSGDYHTPLTLRNRVEAEGGICTQSDDPVVGKEEKTDVTIERQKDGKEWRLDWD